MGKAAHSDGVGSSRAGSDGLNFQALREILVQLAQVAEEVIADAEAADARMMQLSEVREARFDSCIADDVPYWTPDPRGAVVSMRSDLANRAAREHRDAAREFGAWWADVASLTLATAASGQPVSPIRVSAADPTICLGDAELKHLPEVPEFERDLTRLAADMATVRVAPEHDGPDMAAVANERAARFGLRISYAAGETTVQDDGFAEARRRRLWGDIWIEARVPCLPGPNELTGWLTGYGVPHAAIVAAVEATQAVSAAVAAQLRVQELENDDSEDNETTMSEIESLWDQADRLTALLATYSRTITDILQNTPASGKVR